MRFLITVLLILISCTWCWADDVVSMPTANQLKAGEVDVAAYYFGLDNPPGGPQNVNMQALNVGLTDTIEFDVYRADIDTNKTAAVATVYYKLLSETPTPPDLVVGWKNIFGTQASNNTPTDPNLAENSKDRSYFLCASQTVFLSPAVPAPPVRRRAQAAAKRRDSAILATAYRLAGP